MVTIRANVVGRMLAWARKSAGYSLEEAAQKILGNIEKAEQIESWEQEISQPTTRQLFKLSEVYKRPLGVFYLSELPTDFTLPKDFRRLPGEKPRPYSPSLRMQLRLANERREAVLDILREAQNLPQTFNLKTSISEDPEAVGTQIRSVLGVTLELQKSWRDKQRYKHLNEWRSRIENQNILVFQATSVDTSEMLGFALAEEILPIIAINRKLKPNGRIFTLLHEFAHLMLKESGVSDYLGDNDRSRPPEEQRIEIFCNSVAGAALIPASALLRENEVSSKARYSEDWTDDEIDSLSERYGTSREVVVRRLLFIGKTTEKFYRRKRAEYYAQLEAILRAEKERGDSIPENRAARAISVLGSTYVKTILEGHYQGHINLAQVAGLLGEKLKWLPDIERRVQAA